MTQPSAKIICDSISEQGHRLVTMEVVMHRFILAEMNTHRAFSRNSASSRAIPSKKILDRVKEDPAYPVHWGSEQKGMQSGPAKEAIFELTCKDTWDMARDCAVAQAEFLVSKELHKSLCNRLLEPFMWHTVIITATEWDNFFWQRCHPDAQPEMKAVADEMQRAYFTSKPKELAPGEWHLPYIRSKDYYEANMFLSDGDFAKKVSEPKDITEVLKRVSTARCAGVSFLNHDGTERTIANDMRIFETRLYANGHWSPFEHVATPVRDRGSKDWYSSNFIGWKQFRKEFRDENRTNFIPNLPDLSDIRERMLQEGHNA